MDKYIPPYDITEEMPELTSFGRRRYLQAENRYSSGSLSKASLKTIRQIPCDRAFAGGRQVELLYPVRVRCHQKGSRRTCKGYVQPSEPYQQSNQGVDVCH